MSNVTNIDDHRKTATQRLLDDAVMVARGGETDAWTIADDCFGAVAEKLGMTEDEIRNRDPQSKYSRPLWQIFEELETEIHQRLRDEHLPLPEGKGLGRKGLEQDFLVAKAWEPLERSSGSATYTAHASLSRLKLEADRKDVLEHLVRKEAENAKRAKRPVEFVTGSHVREWRSRNQPPKPVVSFLEKVEKRVRNGLNASVSPGWQHVAQGDRESIARTLKIIANELESGEFPKTKDGHPCL